MYGSTYPVVWKQAVSLKNGAIHFGMKFQKPVPIPPCKQPFISVTINYGKSEIYVMNADGTNQVNLTNHPAGDGDPSWSPGPLALSPKEYLLLTFWGKVKHLRQSTRRTVTE